MIDKLIHQQKNFKIDTIRKSKISSLNNTEKFEFLIYIVYRYRNNIFHGNKGVTSWTKYEEQIDKCVQVMTFLIDEYNKLYGVENHHEVA